MTLDRATVEQMIASEFRPDDELIDALAEDWLQKEEALTAIAEWHIAETRNDYQAIARAALAPQTETEVLAREGPIPGLPDTRPRPQTEKE